MADRMQGEPEHVRRTGRWRFFLRTVLASLLRRRSRLLVALLSITVGATILSGLVTIYYDIPRQMGAEFRSYGANMVLLPTGEGAATGPETAEGEDAEGEGEEATAESAAGEGTGENAGENAGEDGASEATTGTEGTTGTGGGSLIMNPNHRFEDLDCLQCHDSAFVAAAREEAGAAVGSAANAPATSAGTGTATATISPTQLAAVRSLLPASEVVGITPYRYDTISVGDLPFILAGTDFVEVETTSPFWNITGQWPVAAGQALVGNEVANTFRLEPGDGITVSGTAREGQNFEQRFEIAGIVQTGGQEEAFVFVSLTDYAALFGGESYDIVELSINSSGEQLERYAADIEAADNGLTATLVKRVTQSQDTVLGKLQSLVYLVTAVVLLLTLICVATTMMAVVAERRREIGLRKALGASNGGVALAFLGEGLATALIGGALGAAAGFGFAQLVSLQVFGRAISFTPIIAPLTILVALVVTALACIPPVRSATKVDPALVLKGE
ncbi:MAG: FtsX-like permease family protein [Coriobacteriales bacterium]|jgi:putative ABC transport system permease protein|nr:FtsX-like permease family protein [Coriobacteriales bacterium]